MEVRKTLSTREEIKEQLLRLLKDAREDWDTSQIVTEETGLFNDLGFESIDAVGLSASLENQFDQALPFPEFMARAKREEWKDITVGSLIDFLMANVGKAKATA